MKEVVIVSAYVPDNKRMELLNETVNFFYDNNKDIILVSHSANIPELITQKCKYNFYSYDNKLVDDNDFKQFLFRQNSVYRYGSKFLYPYSPSTFLPIYNLLLSGCAVAKIFGYQLIHYVEYDANFSKIDIIDFSSQKITEGYDAFIISETDNDLNGGFFSFNLDKYQYSDFEYDENVLLKKFRSHVFPEKYTRNEFLKELNKFIITPQDAFGLGYQNTKHIRTKHDSPFVFPVISEDSFFIVHDNNKKNTENLIVIVNDKNIFEKKTDPHVFNIINIGSKQDVNKIVIIVDDVIQRIYDVSTDEKKQIIKDNCYILKIN